MVLVMAGRGFGGSQSLRKWMSHIVEPYVLAAGSRDAFDRDVSDSRYRKLPGLAIRLEIDLRRLGRQPRRNHRPEERRRTARFAGENGFERDALGVVGATVNVHRKRAIAFGHRS